MKKICLVLALMLFMTALVSCGSQTGTTAGSETASGSEKTSDSSGEVIETNYLADVHEFSAGFARVVITPQDSVPMAGYGNNERRLSTGYLEDLLLTCVAIADGEGSAILMFTSDLQNSKIEITSEIRPLISAETGIPEDHILMTATHTHSGVDLGKGSSFESVAKYLAMYKKKIVEVALQALSDLKPAEMYYGTADLTGYNFVKHYVTDLGESVGDNYGLWATGTIVGHQSDANGMVYMLKLSRSEDKDIFLLNWRAHPNMVGGSDRTDISADYVAPLRETIEAETGALVAFYQGEAGNINATSRISSENVQGDVPVSDKNRYYVLYGQTIGGIVAETIKENNMKKLATGPIKTIQTVHSGKANHTTDSLASKALPITQYFAETNDRAGTNEMCREAGFASVYAAGHAVSRVNLGATYDIEIHVTKIGDFMMAHCPNEVFDSLGMMIREGAPTESLFILGYSNQQNFYIPSQAGFDYGCYEADCTNWAPGEGEVLVQHFIELLNELYDSYGQ